MTNRRATNVMILGGGIGGLTVAHELRRRGFRGSVDLVETFGAVGGVARSSSIPNTGKEGRANLPTEVSWRGEGFDYQTLHQILKEIAVWEIPRSCFPSDNDEAHIHCGSLPLLPVDNTDSRTIKYDDKFLIPLEKKLLVADWNTYLTGSHLSWKDKLRVWGRLAVAVTACQQRRRSQYANMAWQDFLQIHPVRETELHNIAVRAITPSLGPDPYRASASSIMEYLETTLVPEEQYYPMMVVDRPTSEGIFSHWHRCLVHTWKVNIHLFHTVETIHCDFKTGDISSVVVRDQAGKRHAWHADYYVNALPPHVATRVLPIWSLDQPGMRYLAKHAQMHMPAIQFYFNERLLQSDFPAGVFLLDTPWLLTFEPQGSTWNYTPYASFADKYGDGTIRDVWSVTLCDDDRRGWNGKRWRECTKDEAVSEVWTQLVRTKTLASTVKGEKSGLPLSFVRYVYAYVWPTFVDARGYMQPTIEPMISSNSTTWESRPETRSKHHRNMLWSTAYNKNPKEMVRMDAACQAGVMAAETILAEQPQWVDRAAAGPKRTMVDTWDSDLQRGGPRWHPYLLAPWRLIDQVAFALGWNHPADGLGVNGLVYMLGTLILFIGVLVMTIGYLVMD